ncbi:aspartate/glutamate racemase family protein [Chloroflexota bacterium]
MKTIGLIGGMSWESSIEYYRIINETVRQKLGGLHSSKSVMVSVDFAEIEELQQTGRWEEATQIMVNTALQIESGGANFLLICTNTMHRMAPQVIKAIKIPLLHIADATAARVKEEGIRTIGLLGTRYTMEEDFYSGRLQDKHGLTVLLPDEPGRKNVHRIIYNELVQGIIKQESKQEYIKIIHNLSKQGAEGIILGCTEIGLLVQQKDSPLPVFDTARIHAEAAVEMALNDRPGE